MNPTLAAMLADDLVGRRGDGEHGSFEGSRTRGTAVVPRRWLSRGGGTDGTSPRAGADGTSPRAGADGRRPQLVGVSE